MARLARTRFSATLFLLFTSLFPLGFSSEAQAQPGEASFQEGLKAFQAQRTEEALRLFQRAISEDPSHVNAHFFLGLTNQRLGDHEKAAPALQRALELNPQLLEARSSLGVSLFRLRRYPEAVRELSSVLTAQPENASAHFFLGLTYQAQKDHKSAVRHFERAAELDRTLAPSARFNLGLSYQSLEELDKAKRAFEEVKRLEPGTDLAASAEEYLRVIERREKAKRPWSIEVEAGVEYSDNITRIEQDQVTNLSDIAGTISLAGEYRFLDVGGYTGSVGYDFFQSLYAKVTEQNFQSHNGSLTFVRALDPWEFGLSYRFNYNLLDQESFLQIQTFSPRVGFFPTPALFTDVSYQLQEKVFFQDEDRDAIANSIGFNQFLFFPEGRGYLLLSYRYEVENANAGRLDFHAHSPSGTVQVNLPWKAQARFGFSLRAKEFEKETPDIGKKREDDVRSYRFSFKQDLIAALTATLTYRHTNSGSNLSAVDFTENSVAVVFSYKF